MPPFILLVNPWIHDFAAYDLWLKPVGLLSIAATLQQLGVGVHLIDCLDYAHPAMQAGHSNQPVRKEYGDGHFHKTRIPCPPALQQFEKPFRQYGISRAALQSELRSLPRPAAVFVGSMMTYWYTGVAATIAAVRECLPAVPVYLGGIYATLCSEHARRHSGADKVVTGPFTPELLHEVIELPHGSTARQAPFPRPDCRLQSDTGVIPLLTSRGCPNRCRYCASQLLYSGFEQLPPRDIVDTVTYWHEHHGSTDFAFYDDALLVNARRHFIPMAEGIVARGLKVRFHVPNGLHARYISDEIAVLLKAAGFTTLRLGFETADAGLQKTSGGKVSSAQYLHAARALARAGFSAEHVGVYILAGLPGQSATQVADSIRFVHRSEFRPMVAEYSPIPGTAFWNDAVQASPFPIADEPLFHNNSLLPCRWERCRPQDLLLLKRYSRNPAAECFSPDYS